MRGYLTEEEEFRLASILEGGAAHVTPPEYVRDFTELHLQGMVWTNGDKKVRLTDKGRDRARKYMRANGYSATLPEPQTET